MVDDDRTVRNAVVRALDTAGYATVACGSADRALELAGELRSDLVVLEMVLDGQVVGLELGSTSAPPVRRAAGVRHPATPMSRIGWRRSRRVATTTW